MAISDAQYEDWLEKEHVTRVVLLEAEYYTTTLQTFYASNYPYVSGSSDTPADISYEELLANTLEIHSRIDTASGLGTIDIINSSGEYDDLMTHSWEGRDIRIYIGDPSWDRDDFRNIFKGVTESLAAPTPYIFRLNVKDRKEILNYAIQTNEIADTGHSEGKLIPLAYGKCHNISPRYIVTNATNDHDYRVHDVVNEEALSTITDSDVYDITELRDKGAILTRGMSPSTNQWYLDKTTGMVSLYQQPDGTITCDIEGPTGTDTVSGLLDRLIDRFAGEQGLTVDSTLINTTNWTTFLTTDEAAYTAGLFLDEKMTYTEAFNLITKSISSYWTFNRLGQLEIHSFTGPSTTPDHYLVEEDIVFEGITMIGTEAPKESIALGYHKNYTIQSRADLSGVAADINKATNMETYATESEEYREHNTGITTKFPLADAEDVFVTVLQDEADTILEAQKRAVLRNEKHFIYKIRGFSVPFKINIGETVNVTHTRYGFENGKNGLVIGLIDKPTTGELELEIWV